MYSLITGASAPSAPFLLTQQLSPRLSKGYLLERIWVGKPFPTHKKKSS